MASARLQKTIDRLQQRIADGSYYEAHQQIRTVAARYVRQKNFNEAIDLIYSGARSLLEQNQGGSGGDLALYLVEVYQDAKIIPDQTSRARIIQLAGQFKSDEQTRPPFFAEAISWSIKTGDNKLGDRELLHVFGSIYAKEGNLYAAEKYLLLGTRDSPLVFVQLLIDCYADDSDVASAPLYAFRAVLGYLAVANIRDAKSAYREFIAKLQDTDRGAALLRKQEKLNASGFEITIYPSCRLFEFMELVILACQYRSPVCYQELQTRYKPQLNPFSSYTEPLLNRIGMVLLGISDRTPVNPLQSIMNSFFGGGSNSSQPAQQQGITAPDYD